MYKMLGNDPSKVEISTTFTNAFVNAALKLEGITPTSTPAGPNG